MNIIEKFLSKLRTRTNPYILPPQAKLLTTGEAKASLTKITKVNSKSCLIRCGWQTRHCLGTEIGQYVNLRLSTQPNSPQRSYVPISLPDQSGHCDFFVRETGGSFSTALLSLPLNAPILISGPHKQFIYKGYGALAAVDCALSQPVFRNIALLLYGSSIASAVALIHSIESFYDRDTGISLVWVCKQYEDFVFLKQLHQLVERHKLALTLMLEKYDGVFPGNVGKVTQRIIHNAFPSPTNTATIVCGNNSEETKELIALLQSMGYKDNIALL